MALSPHIKPHAASAQFILRNSKLLAIGPALSASVTCGFSASDKINPAFAHRTTDLETNNLRMRR